MHQRADAASSLVYEANARMRDPVYGCVGAISHLQNQVSQLQMQLAVAQAEIICIQMQQQESTKTASTTEQNNNFQAEDDKSFLLRNNNNLSVQQYLNFATSSDHHVIQESFRKESLFGHGMIS